MSVQESNNYEKMSALLNDIISLMATMPVSLMDSFVPKWQVPKSISSYAGDGTFA